MSIEAMKQALEAWDLYDGGTLDHPLSSAMESIRTAIEQAEKQEPVGYAVYHRMGGSKSFHWPEQHSEDGDASQYKLVPLYPTPPAAQREWVGLTDKERNKIWRDVIKWGDPSHDDVDLMKTIEAKLKEKNP